MAFLRWEVCSGKSKRPCQTDDQATEKSCRLRSDKSFVKWNEYDLSLIEKISSDWVRLNLRPAKAKGMAIDEIAWYLVRSAEWGALSFTRKNVYNFCVKLDGSERMKVAAAKVLDEHWLPSHSEQ